MTGTVEEKSLATDGGGTWVLSREPQQIRVLTLNDGEHLESTLFRLQKGWKLQFRLGATLLGRRIRLYVNHPQVQGDFERNRYRIVAWQHESRNHDDDTAMYADVPVVACGSFHFYFVDDDSQSTDSCGSGHFLVDPVLTYGADKDVLPLDGIHCQTYLTKCLGPLSQWRDRLRVAKETGYNMIHFTPVQELGSSQSSYSLKDQHKLNLAFNDENRTHSMADLRDFTEKLASEWKMLSICDIVLNHTANESPWLLEHPDSTYNLINSPHLRPAFLLDRLLHYLAVDIGLGKHEGKGIGRQITTEEQLQAVGRLLTDELLPPLRLHEFYTSDANELVAQFLARVGERLPPTENHSTGLERHALKLVQDPCYRRRSSGVHWDTAMRLYNVPRPECRDEASRRQRCAALFRADVDKLNGEQQREIEAHLAVAVANVLSAVRYERLQYDGPRLQAVDADTPLVPPYFYRPGACSMAEEEAMMSTADGAFVMAHNGWVMNDNPLRNFAEPGSNVYLRRELVAWGDSVKLRYGHQPEDSPYLWKHMRTYAEETARVFHGIRLDNCHSTPIHVAEWMLDAARKVRPELYVIAELFTNSDQTDNVFVNRLGISSLIREGMSASDSHELGRLVHRFGGEPVGAFVQPLARPLRPSVAHAIFVDQTHDNPSPVEKRSVYDLLPSAALISMSSCATGSNRGYDELVPHHIHVVKESRLYATWQELSADGPDGLDWGILKARRALNELHFQLASTGFTQVFVDQMTADVVAVTRHCPVSHQSVVLVAHTAFTKPDHGADQGPLRDLVVEGCLQEVLFEAHVAHKDAANGGSRFSAAQPHSQHPQHINGYGDEYVCQLRRHLRPDESAVVRAVDDGSRSGKTQLEFRDFVPGSVLAVRLTLDAGAGRAVARLRRLISGSSAVKEKTDEEACSWEQLQRVISTMTLADMNVALFRCDAEEVQDERPGVYVLPDWGPLIYCGLQGVVSLLASVRPDNDLGHPLCHNLRQGDWLANYLSQRLLQYEGTVGLGRWLESALRPLADLPRYLVPCYFDAVVTGTYLALIGRTWSLMSRFVNESSTFVKALALGSVQFAGTMGNAPLPDLAPGLAPPAPRRRCVTLSAGLPHFSVGYMRNWGRDTFIALRGLFLLTGRYQEARYIILAYAGCLRHGLIPNLLDGGAKARFNCRDSVWWWLQSIKDFYQGAPQGHAILDDAVSRLFPDDDSPPLPAGTQVQPLCQVMQEAVQRHFEGVSFRERNAGRAIDAEMSDAGFDNRVGVDADTGFVYGGNGRNCGTWMDKMGSSAAAGNKGTPATPRDGSAVEIVGLCRSVVAFLWRAFTDGRYPFGGVQRTNPDGTKTRWTFEEWYQRIDASFERHFHVSETPDAEREPRPELVNRRAIYKDSHLASTAWADFQLRPNFLVSMAVAPEMFEASHAWAALQMVETHLLGPLGVKTLDPQDWAYRGDYDNADQGDDASTAHGFNYHQGPEWLWPVGYLLRALLHFAPLNGGVSQLRRVVRRVKSILSRHFVEVQRSPWRSLPELTNSQGQVCRDSSPAQAWSVASILEVLYELDAIEQSQKLSQIG